MAELDEKPTAKFGQTYQSVLTTYYNAITEEVKKWKGKDDNKAVAF